MNLLLSKSFSIITSLDKEAIVERLTNSIGVEGPETKRKIVCGQVNEKEFRVTFITNPKTENPGRLTLEGKIKTWLKGTKVEIEAKDALYLRRTYFIFFLSVIIIIASVIIVKDSSAKILGWNSFALILFASLSSKSL